MHNTHFREGDVLDYTPYGSTFCREGVALVRDGHALDTYWRVGGDQHLLTDDELNTATVRFNVNDFVALDRYATDSRGTWEKYAPQDRGVISSQHRLQFDYFIRKGAEPDHATQVENARQRLREAEYALLRAQCWVASCTEALAALTGEKAAE